jgi:hypothetical protein
VQRPADGSIPPLPNVAGGGPAAAAPLPLVIQGLVQERRKVKGQMKGAKSPAEYQRLNIQQQVGAGVTAGAGRAPGSGRGPAQERPGPLRLLLEALCAPCLGIAPDAFRPPASHRAPAPPTQPLPPQLPKLAPRRSS